MTLEELCEKHDVEGALCDSVGLGTTAVRADRADGVSLYLSLTHPRLTEALVVRALNAALEALKGGV